MSRLKRLVPANTLVLVALGACAAPPQRPGETEPDPDYFDRSFHTPVRGPARLPPLLGGTVLALRDGSRVVVADPDRDRVQVVQLEPLVVETIELPAGALPFRLVEHGDSVSITLRGRGEVLTFPRHGGRATRRAVCAEPRGLADDTWAGQLVIACASGELMALPYTSGPASLLARLPPDLRDIDVDAQTFRISRFRAAELIELPRDTLHAPLTRKLPVIGQGAIMRSARVMWRMRGTGDGRQVLAHQLHLDALLGSRDQPALYYRPDPCGRVVTVALTVMDAGTSNTVSLSERGLPLDVAISPNGREVAMVFAGDWSNDGKQGAIRLFTLPTVPTATRTEGCPDVLTPIESDGREAGVMTSVDYLPDGRWVAFQTEPPAILTALAEYELEGASVRDFGRDLFHWSTPSSVACATCHPEGAEDGHVWLFPGDGPRRTQTLLGGLSGTEPLHWRGDLSDMSLLVTSVLQGRMSGPELSPVQLDALTRWIDNLPEPAPIPPVDALAAARGRVLFERPDVGCADCHAGPRLGHTGESTDVGTDGLWQVPGLLGIAQRLPLMHNGCATSLHARFEPSCGGTAHGDTAHLAPAELDDLVSYLESL